MKKLTKQPGVATNQSPAPGSGHTQKKKAKTTSSSFTPYNKSATQSELNLPRQRYSVGTAETPLAINQNIEYFASGNQGATPSAQAHHRLVVQQCQALTGKPSVSQLASSEQHQTAAQTLHQHSSMIAATAAQSTKNSKVSTLKNKAAFENLHPSQQLAPGEVFSPHGQVSHKQSASMHSTQTSNVLHATAGGTAIGLSKLSQYQKMSGAAPQKSSYVRRSSKKTSVGLGADGAIHSMAGHQLQSRIHVSQLDDKVKKSSSQSLIKMQAAQMISASQPIAAPGERKSTFKSGVAAAHPALSKKGGYEPSTAQALASVKHAQDAAAATTTKKLIFQLKKGDKQKVTPPTPSAPKPGTVGHHRRVQSHGTQPGGGIALKPEQSSPNKVHSPKVEKASVMEIFSSEKTSTVQPSVTNETVSQPGHASSQIMGGTQPALSKSIKGESGLNKSRTSLVSHTSMNGSREQVSIISLNSFSRSTPKFTQVLSLPTSAINYQASLSRTGQIPSKMLSPQSQTHQQVKQSQITPAKTISIREKKAAASSVPQDGVVTSAAGSKKASKLTKHQKLRLKHTQSTIQPSSSGNQAMGLAGSGARQMSPGAQAKHKIRDISKPVTIDSHQSSTTKGMPRLEMKQISSRNQLEKERLTKSNGSIKEPSSLIQSGTNTAQHQFQSLKPSATRKPEVHHTEDKDHDFEAVGEEFPTQPNDSQLYQQESSHKYKVVSGAHHQKSNSMPQATLSSPGIYNMYMGQVKQLKKQRITLQKGGAVANNTQPTHYINLNSESNLNLVQSHASNESLKKSTSTLPSASGGKPKMTVTGKAPVKLHLTMPPSAHVEKSHMQADLNPLQDSVSQEHDMPATEPSNRLPLANQVPVSLTNMQSQGMAQKHFQSLKPGQLLTSSTSAVQMPGSLMHSQSKLGTLTPHTGSQQPPQKSLTIKHKQLAKAIKQHHQNMVRQGTNINAGPSSTSGYTPITAKTLSASNHHGRLGEDNSHLLLQQHAHPKQLIRSTLSPSYIKQSSHHQKNHSSSVSAPHQLLSPGPAPTQHQHSQQIFADLKAQQRHADQFMSERKSTKMMHPTLDGPSIQKCWVQNEGTSSLASDERLHVREFDYTNRRESGSTLKNASNNMVGNDASGTNPQQISAAIIKKIQNNYQVQVTNTGYDSAMTTASAQALNSITQKIKNETTSVLPYLQALQEIQEVYPQNQPLNTLLSQIHQGISTLILSKEAQIQQSHDQQDNTSKLIQAKEEELKQANEHIQHLERNEQETRRSIQHMTGKIDERDYMIEKLEQKIHEHQKRARLMFKRQIAEPQDRLKVDLLFDGNCSELERQSDERRKVFSENEELQVAIDELNEDMAYGKQRENKLMFFLYILKQMGYPISEVFEREIKDVPTSRFSKNFDDEYKVMHAQLWKERKEAKKEAKLVQQNGFGIDRDDILIESLPKSDRLVPLDRKQHKRSTRSQSPAASILPPLGTLEDEEDLNFHPLQAGPTLVPEKPEIVPYLDINKVLIIKYRRAKGLSVSNLVNRADSLDNQSQSSEESLDSRGRPKRCPKPRLHKKILDSYGITTGARNILALESKVFRQKYDNLLRQRSNTQGSNSANNLGTHEDDEDELRFTLNSYRADSIQSQRI